MKKIMILLMVTIFVLASCANSKSNNSGGELSTSETVGSSQTSSESVPSEGTSSGNTDEINPGVTYPTDTDSDIAGVISSKDSIVRPRDDAYEVLPDKNIMKKWDIAKGGVDTEAVSRRNQISSTVNTKKTWSGTTYYISPDGEDYNDGKTPNTAIRSLNNLDALNLQPEDAVLLERGSVFRITEPVLAKSGVTYGAYGTGNKPAVYGSPQNYAQKELWEPSKMKNVWKVDYPYFDAGVVVFNHGESVGVRMGLGLNQLTQNGHYFHNNEDGILYLYYDKGNPGALYNDIEITQKGAIFQLSGRISDVTIDNLCLKYSGAFAVSGLGYNDNVTISNCEIGWIGGSKYNDRVCYGNAIQFWDSCKNIRVENCWIYQTFDTALTFQGSAGKSYENIWFVNNLLEYNACSIEFWDYKDDFKIVNTHIEGNIMRFASQGWGSSLDGPGARGLESHIVANTNKASVLEMTIKNNVFDSGFYSLVYWGAVGNQSKLKIEGNTFYASSNKNTKNTIVLRFGQTQNGANIEKSANTQSEFEAAVTLFDKSPKHVKWLG